MQRDRQFDDAEACAKMTARYRDSIDCLGSQLGRKPRKFGFRQLPQIIWIFDLIQQRRLG
jgi:hypothetical protein